MKLAIENVKINPMLRDLVEQEIEKAESAFKPAVEFHVCIDVSGDHLYHFKGDVVADGKVVQTVNVQHHDIIKAVIKLIDLLKNTHVRTKT